MEAYFINRDASNIYLTQDDRAAQRETVPAYSVLGSICQDIAERYLQGNVNDLEMLYSWANKVYILFENQKSEGTNEQTNQRINESWSIN